MANSFTYKNEKYNTGDTIRLNLNVTEGDKTRVQTFEGIIIAIKNSGSGKSFTVRKIGAGAIGVERIMPVDSPTIESIEVKSRGQVRRAKLYYLRDRIGKRATKVKTKVEEKVKEAVKPKIEVEKKASPKKKSAAKKTTKSESTKKASK